MRLLAQLRVAGELSYGTTTLKPFLDASYTTDDEHSYVDSLGNAIPEQGIALGQIEAGMDFSTMMPVSTGELELWGGVFRVSGRIPTAAALPPASPLTTRGAGSGRSGYQLPVTRRPAFCCGDLLRRHRRKRFQKLRARSGL